jgi:hypothetical protein
MFIACIFCCRYYHAEHLFVESKGFSLNGVYNLLGGNTDDQKIKICDTDIKYTNKTDAMIEKNMIGSSPI